MELTVYLFFRNQKLKDQHEEINFQTDFVMDLAKEADYGHDLDVSEIFHSWEHDKGAFSRDFVRKKIANKKLCIHEHYSHELKRAKNYSNNFELKSFCNVLFSSIPRFNLKFFQNFFTQWKKKSLQLPASKLISEEISLRHLVSFCYTTHNRSWDILYMFQSAIWLQTSSVIGWNISNRLQVSVAPTEENYMV